MPLNRTLLIALAAGLLAAQTARAQSACSITQITHSNGTGESRFPSLDGGSVAFESSADLTGDNPLGGEHIFLFDGSTTRQIADVSGPGLFLSQPPSLDERSIAFESAADLTQENPDQNTEIFLFDGSSIRQITHSTSGGSFTPRLDRGSIAFTSTANLAGRNPDESPEIFLFDGSTITQVTDSPFGGYSTRASLYGDSIAFESTANLTGENPNDRAQIFIFDGLSIKQVTHSTERDCFDPSLHGSSIAFRSSADLTGENEQGRDQIFLFNGSTINQITDNTDGFVHSLSFDGSSIAFTSSADLTGDNPDSIEQVFLFDGSGLTQVTHSISGSSAFPSLQGNSIAFESTDDLTGTNPNHYHEIFLATCFPGLPPGPYLTSAAIPGFRFKVRITAGAQVISGQQEADCIGGTLCVSGSLPGRSELFLRIIGPRPNGFLWVNLVRLTPSRVEVWAEQAATGKLNYYELPALPREDTELTGLVDKEAFPPSGAGQAEVVAGRHRPLGAPGVTPLDSTFRTWASSLLTSFPESVTFTSDAFPGYLFTVRIFSGGEDQRVQVEEDCVPETICVSGALPGRSELFLRIIGPRPNGFLWTNSVRFTTSRVEVEIEQLATGETKTYVLAEVPRQSDQLPGRVDREAFLP
jgi:Tol biopolymer transport system component